MSFFKNKNTKRTQKTEVCVVCVGFLRYISHCLVFCTMLSRPETRVQTALEVALVPDSGLCTDVENIVKARMASTCSLLCCLNVDGKLRLSDVSEAGASVQISEDSYTE